MRKWLKKYRQLIVAAITFSVLGTGVTFALPYIPSDAMLDPTCAPGTVGCYVSTLPQTKHGATTVTETSLLEFTGTAISSFTNSSGHVTVQIDSTIPALSSGNIFVGNAGNVATSVALSGDATISNTGVLTIADANATTRGFVSTGAQTIAGVKTFSATPVFSTMTQGSVFFAGASGVLSEDNTNLFFNDTTNQLYAKYTKSSSIEYLNSGYAKVYNGFPSATYGSLVAIGKSLFSPATNSSPTSDPTEASNIPGGVVIGENILTSFSGVWGSSASVFMGNSLFTSANNDTTLSVVIGSTIGGTGIQNQGVFLGSGVLGGSAASSGYGTGNGHKNVAIGRNAMYQATGGFNTAVGAHSLARTTTGFGNTAVGSGAGNGISNGISGGLAGSTNTFLGYNSNYSLAGLTNATAVGANVTLDQSNTVILGNGANIGIGTTTPSARLHISAGGIAASSSPLKFTSGNLMTTPETGSIEYLASHIYFTPVATRNILAQISGSTALSSGSVTFADSNGYLTQNATSFVWDNTNVRLGIGISAPTERLHIVSNTNIVNRARLESSTTGAIDTWSMYNSSGGVGTFYHNNSLNGPAVAGSYAGIPLASSHLYDDGTAVANTIFTGINFEFVTGLLGSGTKTEIMRITDTGFVGIGTTSPAYKLDVSQNAADFAVNIFNDGNATTRKGMLVQAGEDAPSATNTYIEFRDGDGTLMGAIDSSGGSNTLAYSSVSDRRLKQNIIDTNLSINDLMQVKVRDYTWINDPQNRLNHGFIAQELYQIYPQAVSKPNDENAGIWMVDYSKLSPFIIKAVQDLKIDTDLKMDELKSMDSSIAGTFGYRVKSFLSSATNGIEELYAKVINTNKVKTKELCVGDVCVNEQQFLQMVQNSGISITNSSSTNPDTNNDNQNTINDSSSTNQNTTGGDTNNDLNNSIDNTNQNTDPDPSESTGNTSETTPLN